MQKLEYEEVKDRLEK